MKKQALTMIALMVLVASLAASVRSQSLTGGKLVANIPFAFSAENQTFPAGEYIVRSINPSSDKTILQISSRDGHHSLMLQMTSTHGKTAEASKLVFHRYGERYFFAQAWTPGDRDGLEAHKSRQEKNLLRDLSRSGPQLKTIALVTSR